MHQLSLKLFIEIGGSITGPYKQPEKKEERKAQTGLAAAVGWRFTLQHWDFIGWTSQAQIAEPTLSCPLRRATLSHSRATHPPSPVSSLFSGSASLYRPSCAHSTSAALLPLSISLAKHPSNPKLRMNLETV